MRRDEMVSRIECAENDAFLTLYRHGSGHGTASGEVDGVWGVWSTHDEDPGYSCVLNLADAHDPVATLRSIEDLARASGARVLGVDASPAVLERISADQLAELGFHPSYQEHMWGRRISDSDEFSGTHDVLIERADKSQRATFARILNTGYEIAADSPRGSIFASTIGQPNWYHYLVMFDGEPGAASVLYVTQGVAQLFVATTVPAFRGRGAQTALIRRRLEDARSAGCNLATSQTVVDNASPRNMGRHGFEVLYTRWIFGKKLT